LLVLRAPLARLVLRGTQERRGMLAQLDQPVPLGLLVLLATMVRPVTLVLLATMVLLGTMVLLVTRVLLGTTVLLVLLVLLVLPAMLVLLVPLVGALLVLWGPLELSGILDPLDRLVLPVFQEALRPFLANPQRKHSRQALGLLTQPPVQSSVYQATP
jgi:hypothetical protein